MGLVYFLRLGDGPIKIGWTRANLPRRLERAQSSARAMFGSADCLVVLHTFRGEPEDERRVHGRFAEHQIADLIDTSRRNSWRVGSLPSDLAAITLDQVLAMSGAELIETDLRIYAWRQEHPHETVIAHSEATEWYHPSPELLEFIASRPTHVPPEWSPSRPARKQPSLRTELAASIQRLQARSRYARLEAREGRNPSGAEITAIIAAVWARWERGNNWEEFDVRMRTPRWFRMALAAAVGSPTGWPPAGPWLSSRGRAMSLFTAYAALWRRIEGDGVWVHYNGLATHEGGHFAHDGSGRRRQPEIQLTRSYYRTPQDEPSETLSDGQPANVRNELLILAHEYGHYLSWKGGTPRDQWTKYHDAVVHRDVVAQASGWEAVPGALTAEEKQLISDEESLAWKLGRAFVPEELHVEYDEKARRGVHNHRFRLGLDDLWPEDQQ